MIVVLICDSRWPQHDIVAGSQNTEFERGGAFHHGLPRYTQALIIKIALTAVCDRHRSLEQQLCRWLLLTDDRTQGDKITMTHDMIG